MSASSCTFVLFFVTSGSERYRHLKLQIKQMMIEELGMRCHEENWRQEERGYLMYTFLGLSKRGDKAPKNPYGQARGYVPSRGASHLNSDGKVPYRQAEHGCELLTEYGDNCASESQSALIGPASL